MFNFKFVSQPFAKLLVMCRFSKRYRLIGKTDDKGETYWKAQVRVNHFQWKNVVTDDWNGIESPYLSDSSSIAYKDKDKTISLLNEWKKKAAYVEDKAIVEYVS